MSSVLTQLGLFHCQQQNRALHHSISLSDNILSYFTGCGGESSLLLSLERFLTQSFIPPAIELPFLWDRLPDHKVQNPLHMYGKYKVLGLVSIFYLAPLWLRNQHIDVLAKPEKTRIDQLITFILYAPRVFCLFYELALNIIFYLPLRIINFFCNPEPTYLTAEQYSKVQNELNNVNDQLDEKLPNNSKEACNIAEKRYANFIQSFNHDNVLAPYEEKVQKKLIHYLNLIHDAIETGMTEKEMNRAQRKEIITATCAAGYFGETCHQNTKAFYR